MITVSILINGEPVYTRSAVNKGAIRGSNAQSREELPNLYEVDDGTTLTHVPNDGAVELAKQMLDTIKEP